MNIDRETLAAIFTARVTMLKKTPDQAAEDARKDHASCVKWMKSNSTQEGSYLWFCDEFDLDPGAVRKAMQENANG